MIYTELTKKALKLCFAAHKEQLDKSGLPYVFHPFHLAEQMPDELTTIVALLHDVVEDTDITLDELRELGFPAEAVDAIVLMTHDKRVAYMDYVTEIKKNPIARTVKLADLRHNSDRSRLDSLSEEDERRVMKYRIAIAILEEDRYDVSMHYYVKKIPLDDRSLCFLSVYYTPDAILHYSVDFEYAADSHYEFKPAGAATLCYAINRDLSLPEALSVYLRSHEEADFEKLLYEMQVDFRAFHFD